MGRSKQMCALIQWYGGFFKSKEVPQTTRVRGIRFSCARRPAPDSRDNFEGNNWAGLADRFTDPLPTMTTADSSTASAERGAGPQDRGPVVPGQPGPPARPRGKPPDSVAPGLGDGLVRLFGVLLNLYHLLLEKALDELAKRDRRPALRP